MKQKIRQVSSRVFAKKDFKLFETIATRFAQKNFIRNNQLYVIKCLNPERDKVEFYQVNYNNNRDGVTGFTFLISKNSRGVK